MLLSSSSLSCVQRFATPWAAARQVSLPFTIFWSLLKSMSIESVMPSNHLILCRPLLLLPPIFPSIRVFSNESALCIRWTKYWRFRFSISPSNEYSGLISFRMDWVDILFVQGTLKSLLQHHWRSSTPVWPWHSHPQPSSSLPLFFLIFPESELGSSDSLTRTLPWASLGTSSRLCPPVSCCFLSVQAPGISLGVYLWSLPRASPFFLGVLSGGCVPTWPGQSSAATT